MSYYAAGSGTIVLQIPSDTVRRQLHDDLLGRYDRLCAEELSQCGEQLVRSVQTEYQERKRWMERYDDPFWWLTTVLRDVGFSDLDRDMDAEDFSVELSFGDNYDEHAVLDVLNMLAPYTQEGCISYSGEDESYWRHQLVAGEWVKLSGQICYDAPEQVLYQSFPKTRENLERLIAEISRQAIYDDRHYEEKARMLLKAYEQKDPEGVLQALTGRRLYEHGVAAGLWPSKDVDKQKEDEPSEQVRQ